MAAPGSDGAAAAAARFTERGNPAPRSARPARRQWSGYSGSAQASQPEGAPSRARCPDSSRGPPGYRLVGAYGVGRVVNPKIAHSQCIGGMVGGIGMALFEDTRVDPRFGRVVNANLAEYLMPVNADIQELEALFVDEHDPHINPLGAKGVAEIAICGVAPAIANAVYHATGRRVRELPITPEKLL
jgi:hypothetical protein